jgi:hypothetical protein
MALREAYDTQPAKEAIFPVTTHKKVPLVSSETVTATDIFQRTSIKEESRRADSNRFTAHYELALAVSACCLVVSESAANARFLADSLFNLVRLMSPLLLPPLLPQFPSSYGAHRARRHTVTQSRVSLL